MDDSANSPTGTIGALACWAADSIKDQYLKRPGADGIASGYANVPN